MNQKSRETNENKTPENLIKQAASVHLHSAEQNLANHKPKGLIIADASDNIDIKLRFMLKNEGFSIYEAANFTETLYFLKSKRVLGIIIDESILKKNKRFIKSLQTLPEFHDNPIFVILHRCEPQKYEAEDKTTVSFIDETKETEEVYKIIIQSITKK